MIPQWFWENLVGDLTVHEFMAGRGAHEVSDAVREYLAGIEGLLEDLDIGCDEAERGLIQWITQATCYWQ